MNGTGWLRDPSYRRGNRPPVTAAEEVVARADAPSAPASQTGGIKLDPLAGLRVEPMPGRVAPTGWAAAGYGAAGLRIGGVGSGFASRIIVTVTAVAAFVAFAPDTAVRYVEDTTGVRVRQPSAPRVFFLGATEDEVRAAQGTPAIVRGNTWHYGMSTVRFRNGRVVGWSSSPEAPLKVPFPML